MQLDTTSRPAAAGPLSTAEFWDWLAVRAASTKFTVDRIALDELDEWSTDPATGDIGHRSGRFFTVQGLHVKTERGPVSEWTQPIINQPEVGILGILVKRFDGVLHCLMQAKVEPGNINVLQLSPTVQATRSNYTRAHRGSAVRYLEYFTKPRAGNIVVDVLQSEHGSWFLRKRNRNMVVEVTGDVEVSDDFCWLSLHQLGELMQSDNLVNMDARTVLSCLPLVPAGGGDPATQSWFTEVCAMHDVRTEQVALADLEGWERHPDEIRHAEGLHFKVIAVRVSANSREVSGWTQPMFQPCGRGVVAFLVKRIDGVLNVLAHARAEPGFVDVVEIGPTVQFQPSSYPGGWHPPFAGHVLDAPPERILFDRVHSEEGGRFYHAENRYLVVELGADEDPGPLPEDYRWLTVRELGNLVAHRNYMNVQARTLVSVLHLTLGLA
ncbi:NDP-hexose 2,3-dehydratase family protein [Lentzea sp. NPDC060358]|uniref:NDP-hexose 2,3-dehydratase family protein n=1 Tax=Lentzea sp. NPDC060358 TaxID=3347103 RepID=UPI00364F17B0